jgi:PAS domain S-box-containing protein
MPHLELLDALGHAVIATDIHGRITHWNAPATALYGWTEEEVRGHNITEVTPSSVSRQQAQEIMAALAAGEPWSGTFSVCNRAGETFSVCVTDLPISDRYNSVVGVVGVSAPLCDATPLPSLLRRIVDAANTVWAGRVVLRVAGIPEESANVPDPHLTQLLSLLIVQQMEAVDGTIALSAAVATPAILMDFGLFEPFEGVYIHVGRPSRDRESIREAAAVMRSPTFVGRLVRAPGGKLFIGASASRPMGAHLFLPLRQQQLQ